MQGTITYQEALAQRIVKEDDYFSVKYPGGQEKLFRLVKKQTGEYVMWGPPTNGEIFLTGKEGYDNFFALANAQVEKEYSFSEIFEEVHACGLPEKEYEVHSYKELQKILDEAKKLYGHPDDANMIYFLASRCVDIGSHDTDFNVFRVDSSKVNYDWLYDSYGRAYNNTRAVRPEATPKSTLFLKTEGCDGSKEKPWICLGNQKRIQEENSSSEGVTDDAKESVSTDELMHLIQEGEKWLAKLKEYASNLK